jgi:hypothetical protein
MRNVRHFIPIRHILAASLAAALVTTAAVAPAQAVPAGLPPTAPGYPTWADVQAAKSSVAATNAEVAVVTAALAQAQTSATAASETAVQTDAVARQAEADLNAATTRADTLSAQADAAARTAAQAKSTVGMLASTLYRTQGEGALLLELVSSRDPGRLLAKLDTLEAVTSTWNAAAQDAVFDMSEASSMRDQAQDAQRARIRLAAQAESTAADARHAAASAAAAVSAAQANTDTLYAQLASLQNTTAALEQRYELGVQVAAQAAAEERQREEAAAAAQRRGSSSGGGASTYPSTSGVVSDPAVAQAYGRGAIGAYGWGSDQFSCLLSLWNMESGWRADALNPSGGAYGIPQALPGSKMAAAGPDWRTNAATQINWGLAYIANRYGSPCGAWNHEMSVYPHWY